MRILFYLYDFGRRVWGRLIIVVDRIILHIILSNPRITKGKNIISIGLPIIRIDKNARIIIGDGLAMHDGKKLILAGRDQKCILKARNNAELIIGNNVGMTSSTIVTRKRVVVGNNSMLGQNTVIYDSNFHSLKVDERLSSSDPGIITKPVIIGENVFFGAHSTILKGVTIGDNAIIGACSVVTRDIPANEVWGGNPARFIKKID